jgi:PAS domain S-box-containing protein
MSKSAGERLFAYGVTVLAVAVAVWVRWLIDPWVGDYLPLATLFVAVAFAVWIGGYRPAVLAAVLGFLACKYLFIDPRGYIVVPGARDLIRLLAYFISCAVIIGFGEVLRATRRRADASREHTLDRQRQLEQAAKKRLEAVRLFVEHTPAAVAMFDRDMKYLSYSRRWLADNNLGDQDITGRSHYDVLPGLPERWKEVHRRCLAGAVEKCDEDHFVRPDGGEEWLRWEVRPWQDDQGGIGGIIIFSEVSTERIQAQQALRASEERSRRLLEFHDAVMDNMGEGLYAVDTQGSVTYMNPAAESLLGWTRAEVLGRRMHDLTHYKHPHGTPCPIRGCAGLQVPHQDKVLRDHDDVFIRKDGSSFPVRYSSSPLRSGGETVGVVVVFRDVTRRKRAEEALRQSERRLAAELEAMTRLHSLSTRLLSADDLGTALDDVLENAIVTSGADFGNIQLYNPHERALEIVAQRGFQQDFLDYFRTVRVKDGSACAQAMQSGKRIIIKDVELDPAYEPHRQVAATAGYRAVQSTPLKSHNGSILGMLSTHFRLPQRVSDRDQRLLDLYARHAADLIERLRSDEALKESEQRFARFMEQLPGLAWIKDLQGRYVYANDAAMKVFRCPRDGLYGKTDEQVFAPEKAAQFKANDRKALASETGVQIIETLEHEDGIVHHSVVSKFPILGVEGSPAFVGGIAIDITDRLRAEEVLAESEQRFRQLAENIKEVFWMSNPQATEILYISPAYEQVWGQSCQSLYEQPRSFLDAIHPDDRDRIRGAALEKHSRGEATDEEYRVVRPDGSVRWVRDRAFPVTDANGRVYRMVGIAEDITEKKLSEEALKEAARRKDEFLATLAHELRNPLAPISNALELIKRADGNPSLMEHARSMMERQLAQMVRLIDDLLDISRITRGKLRLRKDRVELVAVVRSAVEAARPLIDAQAHQLTVTLPPETIHLDADPIRLAQVFSNLLNNAAKYTEKGGRIWLTAERQAGEVVVSVRDTGIGIATEHLSHVFKMFSQVAPALERSQGGLGIGLALVRGLVDLHGGKVEARSAGLAKAVSSSCACRLSIRRCRHDGNRAEAVRSPMLGRNAAS